MAACQAFAKQEDLSQRMAFSGCNLWGHCLQYPLSPLRHPLTHRCATHACLLPKPPRQAPSEPKGLPSSDHRAGGNQGRTAQS
ncbi:hypothetical protein WJX72_010515 [[Myrmecia] bisecta]|uniref:Uncharacterized protein n=1 Tax=[Myrmecia] bisecta TaxID=41462 RepID=A0AAW1QSP2_9CHLO